MIREVGEHRYRGTKTLRCLHGCGCWMDSNAFGGPDGIDPKGGCPNAPKEERPQPVHVDADATCHY